MNKEDDFFSDAQFVLSCIYFEVYAQICMNPGQMDLPHSLIYNSSVYDQVVDSVRGGACKQRSFDGTS